MNNKKLAIITGITGQDGSYLTELLDSKDYIIYGIIRRNSNINTKRINHLYKYESDKLILKYGDLTDTFCINNIINEIYVKYGDDIDKLEIYNLGAMSHVGISYEIPGYTAQVDGIGVLNILEAIRNSPESLKSKIRFYQASTSELYGDTDVVPQSEDTPFNPNSPYSVAKLYGYYITNSYRTAYNMFACNGILFNHESPRRGHNFVTRKITKGIASIIKAEKDGKSECIYLGNMDSKRDWGHAKDYVKGMWLMLQHDKPDNYVLATGKQYTIRQFVEKAFKYIGKTIIWEGEGISEIGKDKDSGNIYIRVNPRYFRPNEVGNLLGNPAKAKEILGWTHEYGIDELISDMMSHDLKEQGL